MNGTKEQHRETVVRVVNLHKSFGDNQVLRGVDLELYKGETLVILGRSGTGKSVLIKCLVGLVVPDAGSVEVLGKDVLMLDEAELNTLRIRVGYLFQEGALYDSMTLEENLIFPMERNIPGISQEQMESRIVKALEDVDLLEARDKMPAELSGGMRKRAGLARTLIMEPDIILYDEPTTGLDPYTAQEINELILRIQKSRKASSIVVTHDMKCAQQVSNRISVLHDGIFIATAPYEDLQEMEMQQVKNYFI